MAIGSLILTQGLGTGTLPGPGSLLVTSYLGGGAVTPPPTPPQTRFTSVLVGGGAISDDTAPEEASFRVRTTSLDVHVYASMLSVDVVERGNLVFFIAQFTGDPDEIYFSYMRPGEQRPIVDPGFGRRGSSIQRTGEGVYTFVVDTDGFTGGKIHWHFWSVGAHQASAFGEIVVPARPAQLL